MKTPYDAAARVRQRELDELRKAIKAEATRLDLIEKRLETIAAALERETKLVADDPVLSAPVYVELLRGERARLGPDKLAVEARLARLREQAAEAFGALRTIETAAADYRSEAARVAANAEQSVLDDMAATATVRRAGAR